MNYCHLAWTFLTGMVALLSFQWSRALNLEERVKQAIPYAGILNLGAAALACAVSLAVSHIDGKVDKECTKVTRELSKRMDEKVDGLSRKIDENVDGLSRKMDDLGRDLCFYAEGTSGRLSYLEAKAGIPRGDSLVSPSATSLSTNGK